jgi:hypothetical protein
MRSSSRFGLVLNLGALLAVIAGCPAAAADSTQAIPSLDARLPVSAAQQSARHALDLMAHRFPLSYNLVRPDVALRTRRDTSSGFAAPNAASTGAIVVSDAGTDDVDVFTLAGKLAAKITGFESPYGLAASRTNLYVSDTVAGKIDVFKSDYKTKVGTLQDPGEYPVGIDVFPGTGLVAVANDGTPSNGRGSVSFYGRGQTKACAKVSSKGWGTVLFGSFNIFGDFFVDGYDPNGYPLVGIVRGGCSATTIDTLNVPNTIASVGSIHISPYGPLEVEDPAAAQIYTYALVRNCDDPILAATTPLLDAEGPAAFAFAPGATTLFVADDGLGAILRYKYPAGGAPLQTISGFMAPIEVLVTPIAGP